jgi:pimeloyl-ACP methyl ester carboxylesterase
MKEASVEQYKVWIPTLRGRLSAVVTPVWHSRLGVVMVHGLGGSKAGPADLFTKLAERLAQQEIGSLRFDMLGEGESDGNYADVTLDRQTDQLEAVLRFARDMAFYERIGVVAESLGAVSVLRQTEWPKDLKTAVLLWPAIEPEGTSLVEYLTHERVREAERAGFLLDGSRKIDVTLVRELLIATESLEADLRDVPVPVLLIHGKADSEVPYLQSVRAQEILPDAKLVLVPDAGHGMRRPQEQEDVITEAVAWMAQRL